MCSVGRWRDEDGPAMGSGETRVTWWRQRQVRRHLGGKWNEALTLCRQARTDGGVDRRVGGGFMAGAAKGQQGGCWRRMPRRGQSARHAAPHQQPIAPKMHAMKHMPKMRASPCVQLSCPHTVQPTCMGAAPWSYHHVTRNQAVPLIGLRRQPARAKRSRQHCRQSQATGNRVQRCPPDQWDATVVKVNQREQG